VGGGNALAKTTIMGYDGDLNVTSTTESAYAEVVPYTAQNSAIGSIPQGPTLRISETDYALSANQAYRDRQLIALPTASRVKDSAGNVIAQSSMRYDEAAYPLIGLGSITGWSDPGTTARGNITTVSRWLNTTNTYLQTHAQYDSAGNARNSWDANGNVSSVDYAAAYQYAYPTSTTSAIPDPSGVRGSSMAFTTSTAYDFNTGLVTSSTNANSQTTTLDYTDALNRLKSHLSRWRRNYL
jgi:YD repeat-containing protein